MAVNVRGTMLCYKYAAKQMIAQGRGGRIVGMLLSMSGFQRSSYLPRRRIVCCWKETFLTRFCLCRVKIRGTGSHASSG